MMKYMLCWMLLILCLWIRGPMSSSLWVLGFHPHRFCVGMVRILMACLLLWLILTWFLWNWFLPNVPLVDVPVSIISNDALRDHLLGKYSNQIDCFDRSFSSPCGEDGADLVGLEEELHDIYSLKVICIVDIAFPQGGGKQRRQKAKKK